MKFLPKRACQVFGFSLAAVALFSIGADAQAQSINGAITFDGSATVLNALGNPVSSASDLATAVKVNFNTAPNYQEVSFNGSGDFAPYVSMWDTTTFQNFTFSPALSPNPVDPLWTVDGFNFKLTSIVPSITVDPVTGGTLLELDGTGILTGKGFDPTLGIFNFTTQSGDGSTSVLSISAGSYATPPMNPDGPGGGPIIPTPLPATIFFVLPALAGLFGWSRRKNSFGMGF